MKHIRTLSLLPIVIVVLIALRDGTTTATTTAQDASQPPVRAWSI